MWAVPWQTHTRGKTKFQVTMLFCRSFQKPQPVPWDWVPALANWLCDLGHIIGVYSFIHSWDTLNLKTLEAPKSFCSFWRHPSSLSTSQILSPVLTSLNLVPLLSDATLGVRGLWGLWKTVVLLQLLCRVRLFAAPWTVARWVLRSFTISWSLPEQ